MNRWRVAWSFLCVLVSVGCVFCWAADRDPIMLLVGVQGLMLAWLVQR